MQKYYSDKGIIRNLHITSGDLTNISAIGPISFTPVELNSVLINNNVFIPELLSESGMSVPSPPQNLNGVPGNTNAVITWSAPASDGGLTITKYVIYVYDSLNVLLNSVDVGLSLTHVIHNLTNGLTYNFTVSVSNLYGPSVPSSSISVIPSGSGATVPSPPTGVTGVAGNQQVAVSWTAPNNGGAAITGYTVTSSPGGFTATSVGTTATVAGLTNGTAYTFTVVATNAIGNSAPSSPSSSVTPVSVPSAPTGVTGVAGNQQVAVSWTAPATGGSAIIDYTVTSNPGGFTVTSVGTTATVAGLTNGTSYTFTVVARNAIGSSVPSSPSSSVTPATVPSAPTGVTGVSGNQQVAVSWVAPSTGGSAIIDYTVTSSPGGFTTTSLGTTATVAGLTNGTAYTFTVVARNAVGSSAPSSPSSSVTPATVPSAPTGVTGVSGNQQVAVSWTAPATGGSAIIDYTVTSSPGGFTVTSVGATTATVTGLTNGQAYTFTVVARNAIGSSAPSSPSSSVTPATVPSAPTGVSGVAGNQQVAVSWTAPSTGGSAIIDYTVTSSPGGFTATSTNGATTATVTGLTNGQAYTFTVVARNAVGSSDPSSPSSSITPATVPSAPTNVIGFSGNQEIVVSWTAPATGGLAIIDYTVTSSPGEFTATSVGTTATVTGLTNGIGYTFTVVARNAIGTSTASAESAPVAPTDSINVPSPPTGVSGVSGNGQVVVSWTAPASTGGSAIIDYTVTSSPGGFTATSVETTAIVSGLTNGTAYTFTVVARNEIGDSEPSSPSSSVIPATVPSAPPNVIGVAGDQQVVVSWTPPSGTGGSAIIDYTVTSSPGGFTVTSVGTTATVTGLTNETAYTFTVVARNAVGNSPEATSPPLTPGFVPGIPQGVVLELAGNSSVRISWATSTDIITYYDINVYDASNNPLTQFDAQTTGAQTQTTIGGLTVGTLYNFTVKAQNNTGQGQPTSPLSITVYNNPSDITVISGIPGNGQATISWDEPSYTGGTAIVSYLVNTYDMGDALLQSKDVSGNITTTIITGLTNGTQYKFRVSASNGALSNNLTSPVLVTPGTPPSVPTPSILGSGYDFIDISWTAPYNGGYTITSYTVHIYDSSDVQITTKTVTGLSTTIDGLINGTTYKLSVAATNVIGTSAESSKLTAATISSPSPPSIPQNVSTTPGIDQVAVNWLAPTSDGGSALTAYRVSVYDASDTQLSFVDVSGDILTTTITNLTAGLVYGFTVSAINAVGTRTSGKITGIPQNIPGPVVDLSGSFIVDGGGAAYLTWNPPSNNGGMPITSYKINTVDIGLPIEPFSYYISPLDIGVPTIYTVIAVNAIGEGQSSSITMTYILPPTIPFFKVTDAPVEVGNTQIRVTWPTITTDGGSPITGYTINLYSKNNDILTFIEAYSVPATERTKLITGLTNGTTYNISLIATNIAGNSNEQFFVILVNGAVSSDFIPIASPFPPTNVTRVLSANGITVSWTAPTNVGDSAITDYTVNSISSAGDSVLVSTGDTSTSKEITGLPKGVTYTFKVYATNTQGNSIYSLPSQSLLYPATAPDAPTNVVASGDDVSVSVTWTESVDNGSAITNYRINIYDSNTLLSFTDVGTELSGSIIGLTLGTEYNVTVTATNNIGTSPESSPYYFIPSKAPDAPTISSTSHASGTVTVNWSAPNSNGSPISDYRVVLYSENETVIIAEQTVSTALTASFIDGNTYFDGTTNTVINIVNGTTYKMGVFAVNVKGSSLESIRVSVIPVA